MALFEVANAAGHTFYDASSANWGPSGQGS